MGDIWKPSSLTPREVVMKAEAENCKLGHEALGTLSMSHGFAPRLTPATRFPEEYRAWDILAAKVPELLSSGRLRKYCNEELPELDGEALPPAYAMRACLILGYTAHSLWNLGGLETPDSLSPSIEKPWRAVSKVLGRDTPVMGFFDLMLYNFEFKEGVEVPPLPPHVEPCPWGSDSLRANGAVDYDPTKATVLNINCTFAITGQSEEHVFNTVMAEVHCYGAPMVRLTVEAQEAVADGNVAELKRCLVGLTEILMRIAYTVFARISQVETHNTYVGGAFWAKIIGAVATPIFSHNIGPGATTAPFVHMFDSLFGPRTKHEHYVGNDTVRLFDSLPVHWKDFLNAVRNGPNICKFVSESDDNELKGLFGAALRSFAGENGFLGRHKLKMYGYLEVVMKLGRTITIGGFGGQFTDRGWEDLHRELTIGQAERFDIPIGALGKTVHKARVLKQSEEDVASWWGKLGHIRLDISNTGIRFRPGSRVGVLWEASQGLVHASLLALAGGDDILATELGNTYQVPLSDTWRKAIMNRLDFHAATSDEDKIIPKALPLWQFLKFADLRPVSRPALQAAYRACGSPLILQLLENHLEGSLQFPDVVTLMGRSGVCVLSSNSNMVNQNKDTHEIVFNSLDTDGTGYLENYELESACSAAGISIDNNPTIRELLQKYDSSATGINLPEFKKKLGEIFGNVDLCDLLEPADFRVYSVASSPSVNPNEISLYISHVQYNQVSPSATTTPLLAGMHRPELRYGAASDYLIRKSMPKSGLAIEAARELSKKNEGGRIACSDSNIMHLMTRGGMRLDQAEEVFDRLAETKSAKISDFDTIKGIISAVMKESSGPLQTGVDVVLFHFEPPRFKLPPIEDEAPIVMIGGGTGVAPFRGFWQERSATRKPPSDKDKRDLLILQMKSRADVPSHLGRELASLVSSGHLQVEIMLSQEEYTPVFTRGLLLWEPSVGRKGYIDSLIKGSLHGHLSHLVRELGAHLYVCGRGVVAKTAIDALDTALSEIYGEEQDVLERMVASERLSLEVFSTNKPPQTDAKYMNLSELSTYNDFVGNRETMSPDGKKKLLMAIEDEIYDVTPFLDLHPGGAPIMHLYCGMDATKAWNGVQHNKAPEILGMLEMYSTKFRLKNVAQLLGVSELRLWYSQGWQPMLDLLVETQNLVALSYQQLWDLQNYTVVDEKAGGHWCTWNGQATYRKKQSIFKGQKMAEVHVRFWLSFLPTLLGEKFQNMIQGKLVLNRKKSAAEETNMSRASVAYTRRTILMRQSLDRRSEEANQERKKLLNDLKSSSDHDKCDVFGKLLLEDLNAEATGEQASPDGLISSKLQSVMEEVRDLDEELLEGLKAGVIKGIAAFEDAVACVSSGEIVTDIGDGPEAGLEAIISALGKYIKGLACVTQEAFGEDRVAKMTHKLLTGEDGKAGPRHGGLHLVGSDELNYDFIDRKLMDRRESIRVGFGAANRDEEDGASKCPFH